MKELNDINIKLADITGKNAAVDNMKEKFPKDSKLHEEFERIKEHYDLLTGKKELLIAELEKIDPDFEAQNHVTKEQENIYTKCYEDYIKELEEELSFRKITKYDNNLSYDIIIGKLRDSLITSAPEEARLKVLDDLKDQIPKDLSLEKEFVQCKEKYIETKKEINDICLKLKEKKEVSLT